MKNIHVLPTNKPSYLYQIGNDLTLSVVNSTHQNNIGRHIYTTSDEEIKDCYVINTKTNNIYFENWYSPTPFIKKIILTTDKDLIADGVQSIPDEFLEWFVKNPSCEFVEVDKEEDELVSPKNPKIRFNYLQDPPSFISAESLNNMILTYKYKIIIPKEERKQETLEEVANKANGYNVYAKETKAPIFNEGFIAGAKWKQEQDKKMYSEEDLMESFIDGYKFRAEASNLIFDNASRMYAIHIFNENFKNK